VRTPDQRRMPANRRPRSRPCGGVRRDACGRGCGAGGPESIAVEGGEPLSVVADQEKRTAGVDEHSPSSASDTNRAAVPPDLAPYLRQPSAVPEEPAVGGAIPRTAGGVFWDTVRW
jgi:hypothetical protein